MKSKHRVFTIDKRGIGELLDLQDKAGFRLVSACLDPIISGQQGHPVFHCLFYSENLIEVVPAVTPRFNMQ